MALSSKLKKVPQQVKRTEPVWKGPEQDGITYSLLCRFLSCRERFRLLVVEGLKAAQGFDPAMDYGNMWHLCEEELAAGKLTYEGAKNYCRELIKLYPLQQEQIAHWYEMLKAQFPAYVAYWAKQRDVIDRTPLLQEQVFDVPYSLPSGRKVRLRGKWDSVDLIGKGKTAGIYLQENKTKSQVDGIKIARQMSFDLQTCMYLVALGEYDLAAITEARNLQVSLPNPVKGVRYNVIRRSAHKSTESMLKKIHEDIENNRGNEWFLRLKVEVSTNDIARFRRECLDPILEDLCGWWEWVNEVHNPFVADERDGCCNNMHWRHPFGVRNILDEGGSSDLDAYLESGSEVGLRRVDQLFPELS